MIPEESLACTREVKYRIYSLFVGLEWFIGALVLPLSGLLGVRGSVQSPVALHLGAERMQGLFAVTSVVLPM